MMPTYKNGYVPLTVLISFGSGVDQYGAWEWLLSPATYARHRRLVEIAFKRTGVRLSPSKGYSCYRPYLFQVKYRQEHGVWAAVPGTSSHGGEFQGRDSLAIDYGNWSAVYGGDRAAFYADVRAAGLTPGVISPANGFPDEPWHVVDFDPWGPVPAFDGAVPFPIPSSIESEADGMIMISCPLPWDNTKKSHVYVTDSGGAGTVSESYGAAHILRRTASKIVDFAEGEWDQFQFVITHAWQRAGAAAGLTADEVAERLQATLTAAQQGISDEDAEKIAEEVADEQARRLQS